MQDNRPVEGFRSLPHKRPYLIAALIGLLQYLSLIATLTLAVLAVRSGEQRITHWLIVSVAALILTSLVGYIRRAHTKCPLCKGTPLLDSHASKHRDACRHAPLNYGTSAVLDMLLTHRFRCMYCGTGFDIFKKSSRRL